MDDTKRQYNFTLIINTGFAILTQFINTDVNLLEMYKAALINEVGTISWEKGAIDLKAVVGIIDNTVF